MLSSDAISLITYVLAFVFKKVRLNQRAQICGRQRCY
jgi:hypothetical protein